MDHAICKIFLKGEKSDGKEAPEHDHGEHLETDTDECDVFLTDLQKGGFLFEGSLKITDA